MSTKVKFGWKEFTPGGFRYIEVFCGRCGDHVQFETPTEETKKEADANLFTGVES